MRIKGVLVALYVDLYLNSKAGGQLVYPASSYSIYDVIASNSNSIHNSNWIHYISQTNNLWFYVSREISNHEKF